MARLTRDEFNNRFLGDKLDLSPREVEQEDNGWVIELENMPYERTASKLREIVVREAGDKPIYLSVGTTMVQLGDIKPSIELINELYQVLHTLGVRLTEDGEEVIREHYLEDAKLPSFTESDYLV